MCLITSLCIYFLPALVNLHSDALEVGIHSEVMASLAMHLGARGVEELLHALFGRTIDCSNMAEELKKLKEQQGHRGGERSGLSQVHKDKIAAALTRRKQSDEQRASIAAATTGRKQSDDHRAKLAAGIAAGKESKRTAELERMRKDGVTIVKVRSESCPQGHEREVALNHYNSMVKNKRLYCLKCKAQRYRWLIQE